MPVSDRIIKDFLAHYEGDVDAAIAALRQAAPTPAPANRSVAEPTTPVLIAASGLAKRHRRGRQEVEALRSVDLTVHTGELLAITGASGSGKSTLLQLLGGLDRPSSGTIRVDGIDINGLRDAALAEFRNKTIGFVFQFFYLQPFLTVRQNLEVPAMFAHEAAAGRQGRAAQLLERVGLADMADRKSKELSGGQIQRVAIARALLNNPKILLADEPTGNLDSANSQGIIDLFQRVRKELGTTVIIVTHNPEIAAEADREVRLADGQVQA